MKNRYRLKFSHFLFFFLLSTTLCAQYFGHEWIVPNQKYYKVKVAAEGMYKISYETLVQNKVDEIFLRSNGQLQLWHRGKQQSLGVKAKGDSLKTGDYLYFYGIKNDGEQDSELYFPQTHLYNQYSNLFSDSTAYFLTVSETSTAKRIDTIRGNNMNNNSYYFLSENLKNYIQYYWNVGYETVDPTETFFTPGEGWSSGGRKSTVETIPILNYQNSDSVTVEVYTSGVERSRFSPKNYLIGNNPTDSLAFPVFTDSTSSDFGAMKVTFAFGDLTSFINNGNIKIFIKSTKSHVVNYIKITYPRRANLSAVNKLHFGISNQQDQSLQISNTSLNSHFLLLNDRNSVRSIEYTLKKDTAYLPNFEKGSVLFYSKSLEEIKRIFPVEFREFEVTDNSYLILTHQKLMASASEFANYRQSNAGGGFDVLLTEINQITDQFGYGERTPLAIRRLLNYLKSKNNQAPKHFFIIGMGIQLDWNLAKRQNESKPNLAGDLIVPAGCPAGDMVYSVGLNGNARTNAYANISSRLPTISTGRLSARNNKEVLNYLGKVKEHDALDESATWRRNVLHLSGGFQSERSFEYNQVQAARFKAYMEGAGNIIKQPYFGANLKSLGRYLSGASELIDVSKEVNNGVSMISFLGHSSRSVTDVTIGYVSDSNVVSNNNLLDYHNKGKYPLLFLNGCVIGNTFYDPSGNEPNFLMDWILTKDRGAIAGISNTGTGYSSFLRLNIENFYLSAFTDSINFGKSIGEQLKLAHERYYNVNSNPVSPDIYSSSMIQNMTLQGDPAVKLFNAPQPDFKTVCERVSAKSFSNLKITSQTDSFELLIPVRNYGMYSRSSLGISVKRSYGNNTKSIQYPPVYYLPVRELDTLRYKIKGKIIDGYGANEFEIQIDPENKIGELNKSNNVCYFTTYIPGNSLACIYPKKFSIVNKQPVTFVAESYTVTTAEREFYFELDTNFRFNSPFKRSFTAKAFNSPKWPDQLLLDNVTANDSVVYYWRVRYTQALASEDTAYSYSSFIYIKGSPEGWSQSEYPQFLEDEARAIKLDSTKGKWSFQKLSAHLKMSTIGTGDGSATAVKNSLTSAFLSYKDTPLIFKKGSGTGTSVCERSGLYLVTINPQDFSIRWAAPNPATEQFPQVYYMCDPFLSTYVTRFIPEIPGIAHRIYDVLKNNVKEGEIVALITMGKVNGFFPLPDSVNQVLKTYYGATASIDTLKDGYPYLLLSRKGYGKIAERFPRSPLPKHETLSIDTVIYSLGYGGYISSPLIGPATEWGNYFRGYHKETTDSIRIDILGIDSAGRENVVVPNVKEDNFSLKDLVDAKKYPFLRLNAYKETSTSNTPQLVRWQVIYRPSPEGTIVINAKSEAEYAAFAKQEGDSTRSLKFTFKNISNEPFQPNLLVRYRISNATKMVDLYDTLKTALLPDSSWISTFKISTLGYVGDNTVEIFFNPLPYSQKEELLENNRYTFHFSVEPDKIHPVLEVAFDGQRIMNGDIISPNPTISIALDDENKYQIRKDTTGITVELRRPCGQANCPFEKVYLGGNDITIYPAGANNKFEIKYKPEKLPDGVYTLRVQAKDVSGNLSGVKPYTIQFEVINEVAITNFLPYPNPFSSRMWFVYTLTGDLPDQLRIQILTITGKVVRQIFMDELGPLRIGTHKTDFIWDGTDDFGDQLANGLYIYKVSARKGGEELKHRNNSADNLFKDGYGKLYILR